MFNTLPLSSLRCSRPLSSPYVVSPWKPRERLEGRLGGLCIPQNMDLSPCALSMMLRVPPPTCTPSPPAPGSDCSPPLSRGHITPSPSKSPRMWHSIHGHLHFRGEQTKAGESCLWGLPSPPSPSLGTGGESTMQYSGPEQGSGAGGPGLKSCLCA